MKKLVIKYHLTLNKILLMIVTYVVLMFVGTSSHVNYEQRIPRK